MTDHPKGVKDISRGLAKRHPRLALESRLDPEGVPEPFVRRPINFLASRSVLECGSPLPLSHDRSVPRAEDSPRPMCFPLGNAAQFPKLRAVLWT